MKLSVVLIVFPLFFPLYLNRMCKTTRERLSSPSKCRPLFHELFLIAVHSHGHWSVWPTGSEPMVSGARGEHASSIARFASSVGGRTATTAVATKTKKNFAIHVNTKFRGHFAWRAATRLRFLVFEEHFLLPFSFTLRRHFVLCFLPLTPSTHTSISVKGGNKTGRSTDAVAWCSPGPLVWLDAPGSSGRWGT